MSNTVKQFFSKSILVPLLMVAMTNGMSAASGCPCSEIPKPEASDPSCNKKLGVEFTHTEEYKEQFAKAVESAKAACSKHLGEPNVCVVSDLDETLCDNRPYELESVDDTGKWQGFGPWIKSNQSKLLVPTADFLSWARQNGFAIFFVTGRKERLRAPTIENLVKNGVAYDGLYMRGQNDDRRAEDVKTDIRNQIEKLGFKIVVNIGDQFSDLYGGHAEDCEKLPNKMYYIP